MTPVIRMRGVDLLYPGPPPVHALRSLDLTLERGGYLTVTGPSGSGKSTFLNIAGLLDLPTTGTYELEGIDVTTLTERRRTALRGFCIGFVFQSFHLLPHRTATENVALALLYQGIPRRARIAAARAALARVGLTSRADATPTTMSGGERQRVAIARALVGNPSLLLCDEPTGNLDSANAQGILDLLDDLHADGMTLVVITHDPEVASRGMRTAVVRDGLLR